MSHREYIDRIIDSDSVEQMHQLKDVLLDSIDYIYNNDENKYHEIEDTLFEITSNETIKFPQALQIVNNMKPVGMKWDFRETEKIRQQSGFDDIRPLHFFLVMNSAYNDYNELFGEDINMYADYSDLFINDVDAVKNKVDLYFTEIPEK